MIRDPLVLGSAAFLAVVFGAIALHQAWAALREWRVRRDALGHLEELAREPAAGSGGEAQMLRERKEPGDGLVAALADRVPRLRDLEHAATQAGLGWSLEGFVARILAAAGSLGLVAVVVTGSPLAGLLAFAAGGGVPAGYVRWRRRRRLRVLEGQLPGAIDLVARAVRAGHPLSSGIRMAGEEIEDPLATELRLVFEEHRFGLPFEDALLGLGDRVELVDVRILITAILVQREVGGNLAEVLEKIAGTMRARFALKRRVRTCTAQGRMSGYTLAALPVVVGTLVLAINPDYILLLFREPVGRMLVAGAGGLQLLGFLWIRSIVNVEF